MGVLLLNRKVVGVFYNRSRLGNWDFDIHSVNLIPTKITYLVITNKNKWINKMKENEKRKKRELLIVESNISNCPVSRGCRTHWLHLCRGVSFPQQVSWWPYQLGLQNTLIASLQRCKTSPTSVLVAHSGFYFLDINPICTDQLTSSYWINLLIHVHNNFIKIYPWFIFNKFRVIGQVVTKLHLIMQLNIWDLIFQIRHQNWK